MKKNYAAMFTALLLTISLAGCGGNPQEEPTQPQQTARAIEVMKLSKESISNEYTYSGKVAPKEEAQVFSTIAGKIAQTNYEIGDSVKKGAVLFRMDTSDLNNQLNVLQASLTAAEASIASAQTNLELANGASMQSQIESAKAALENAELNYNNAKTNYDNNKVLFDAGILSQTEMDQIQLAYNSAEVTYNQAKESYDLVANKMPAENQRKAEDAYNAAVAQKASIHAQMQSTQKTIGDATVTAPISGVITAKNVVAGTVLSQSSPAYVITDMSKVKIDVAVTQEVINTLSVGQQVNVTLSAVSKEPFVATITTINPAANAQGTYDVQVELDNGNGVLKVGMLAEVSFTKESAENTIVLPRDCVIEKNEEVYVFVEEAGKAKKVPVVTGIDTGETIQIVTGLEEGMNVVTKGQTYLSDGEAVEIAASSNAGTTDSSTSSAENTTVSNEEKSDSTSNKKEE